MSFGWSASAADRRLLPEGRLAGPMPWVIAIMMFLTALAAAAGLALGSAARELSASLDGKLTVQIVEANPERRDAQADAAERLLRRRPEVADVRRVGQDEIGRLLAPWLGTGGLSEDLPLPALIDVNLAETGGSVAELGAALARVAPAARIDDHGAWLGPLAGLIAALRWFALALVLLMTGATAAAVVLAARAALNTHRGTIDVLHLMGATDVQIARLFQRRIALDALFGGLLGLVCAILVILLMGDKVAEVGSEMLGSVRLPLLSWILLLMLPLGGMMLATLAARLTVLRALRRIL